MPILPSDLIFWLLIPGLLLVLAFCWLIYLGRGKRHTTFSVSGLGLRVSISSRNTSERESSNVE